MTIGLGDNVKLFGETEFYELLDVWEGEFGLLDDGRCVRLLDVQTLRPLSDEIDRYLEETR